MEKNDIEKPRTASSRAVSFPSLPDNTTTDACECRRDSFAESSMSYRRTGSRRTGSKRDSTDSRPRDSRYSVALEPDFKADERHVSKNTLKYVRAYAQDIITTKKDSATLQQEQYGIEVVLDVDVPRYIMLPRAPHVLCWELVQLCLLIYLAITLPPRLAFEIERDPWDLSRPQAVLDLLMDVFFLVDVIRLTFTAYYDAYGHLIVTPRDVALNYLKTWFLLDFIASFPFDWLVAGRSGEFSAGANTTSDVAGAAAADATSGLVLLRLSKLSRLLKMLRLFRLLRISVLSPSGTLQDPRTRPLAPHRLYHLRERCACSDCAQCWTS
jgi:hypothetical protein